MKDRVDQLTKELQPLIVKINHHPLYTTINSIDDIRIFMGQHVFAVWDFMCLLKELHSQIVVTSAPWFPPKDALSAHLISSILVEEEGDLTEEGQYASHYDTYILAMQKIGADTTQIEKLLELLKKGVSIHSALDCLSISVSTKKFVKTTFSFFSMQLHELAAAFVYGREGITCEMFSPLVKQLEKSSEKTALSTLIYYFKRHIELDDEQHFPKALQMLTNFIGTDEIKLNEAKVAAEKALYARLEFLTDIQVALAEQAGNSVFV
jgi:hypothetical protein